MLSTFKARERNLTYFIIYFCSCSLWILLSHPAVSDLVCYCKVSVVVMLIESHKVLLMPFLALLLNALTSVQAVGCLAFITS